MNTPDTTFTAIYSQWLQSFRALLPGGAAGPSEAVARKQEQTAAHQEWEDEGGSVKPFETNSGVGRIVPGPKIPF
jgi:hypothetical protein